MSGSLDDTAYKRCGFSPFVSGEWVYAATPPQAVAVVAAACVAGALRSGEPVVAKLALSDDCPAAGKSEGPCEFCIGSPVGAGEPQAPVARPPAAGGLAVATTGVPGDGVGAAVGALSLRGCCWCCSGSMGDIGPLEPSKTPSGTLLCCEVPAWPESARAAVVVDALLATSFAWWSASRPSSF
jgi:hypothetical protein